MTEGLWRRGDALLAQANADQAANRATLLRAQQEQIDLGAVGRLSDALNAAVGRATTGGTPLRPNIATGDSPKRRPEPPTPAPNIAKVKHNILYFSYELEEIPSNDFLTQSFYVTVKLFSGSLNTSITFSSPLVNNPASLYSEVSSDRVLDLTRDSGTIIVVLPITSSSCVVLVGFAGRGYASYFGGTVTNDPPYNIAVTCNSIDFTQYKAYYIDSNTAKEINMPTNMANKLQVVAIQNHIVEGYSYYLARPDKSKYDGTISFSINSSLEGATLKFSDISARDYYKYNDPEVMLNDRFFRGVFYRSIGQRTLQGVPASGPGIYGWLNGTDDTTYQPKTTLSPSGIDESILVKYTGTISAESTVYYPIDGVENPVWQKVSRNSRIAQRPTYGDPGNINDANSYARKRYRTFYTDWGKPAYCRQQLLALGFTAADLAP